MNKNNDELRFDFSIEKIHALDSDAMAPVLTILDNFFYIKPQYIERSDSPKSEIKSYNSEAVLEALNIYKDVIEIFDIEKKIFLNIMQSNRRSAFSISIDLQVVNELSYENIKILFLDLVKVLPFNYACCHFMNDAQNLHEIEYEKIGDRTFLASGLFWLNFFGPSEEAKQGGKALETNPHATEIKRLENGLFIQVGESPFDCYTEKGRERLINATKAMPPATW